MSYKFESGVGITLTKGDDQTIAVNAPGGTVQNADFPEGLKKITITSGSAELSTLVTRDLSTDGDEDNQITIDFSTNVATPGEYPTLVIAPGSYFSTGITQGQDGERFDS